MEHIEETKKISFVVIGLILISSIVLSYFLYSLQLEVIQNNIDLEKMRKDIVVNNRNFIKVYAEIEFINKKMTKDETTIIEKLKNELFEEKNIKQIYLTHTNGIKTLFPINQNAKNEKSKEDIKNLVRKLKLQYNLDKYKIEIIWKDGTASNI